MLASVALAPWGAQASAQGALEITTGQPIADAVFDAMKGAQVVVGVRSGERVSGALKEVLGDRIVIVKPDGQSAVLAKADVLSLTVQTGAAAHAGTPQGLANPSRRNRFANAHLNAEYKRYQREKGFITSEFPDWLDDRAETADTTGALVCVLGMVAGGALFGVGIMSDDENLVSPVAVGGLVLAGGSLVLGGLVVDSGSELRSLADEARRTSQTSEAPRFEERGGASAGAQPVGLSARLTF